MIYKYHCHFVLLTSQALFHLFFCVSVQLYVPLDLALIPFQCHSVILDSVVSSAWVFTFLAPVLMRNQMKWGFWIIQCILSNKV